MFISRRLPGRLLYPLAGALLVMATFPAEAALRLPAIFSDHMVLQKSPQTALWGWAGAGEKIAITLGRQKAGATANADGRWSTTIDLQACDSDPLELQVSGTTENLVVRDVLVGEVWLASGQSNMEFRLGKTIDAKEEIAQAGNPLIRIFSVEDTPALTPQESGRGHWIVSTPQTAPLFSAVAYHFAKSLNRELHCPVGMINSSSGGTMIEAWTSLEALASDPGLKEGAAANLAEASAFSENQRQYAAAMGTWLTQTGREDKPSADLSRYTGDKTEAGDWTSVTLPGLAHTGAATIWLKKNVELPAKALAEPLELNLETISGFDTAYWNGHEIDRTTWQNYPGENSPRFYHVPAEFLREGNNVLAVRVFSPLQSIGLTGKTKRFRANTESLAGSWQMAVEREFPALSASEKKKAPKAFPFFETKSRAASLFNGMIRPLIPYTLAGIIWYQGESNAKRAAQYRTALPLLITDWRNQWGRDDLPFYLCQLPNYQPPAGQMPDGAWAELREAQALATKLPHTALASLIDLGETGNLHPRNKRDPGERLARVALAKTYGKDIVCSGPVFEAMQIQGDSVELRFTNTDGGLLAKPLPATYHPSSLSNEAKPLERNSPHSQLEGFALRGENGQWHWADAHIENDRVIASSPAVPKPVDVRYAWSDNPMGNLYNGAGLPAAPFRTDHDSPVTQNAKYGLSSPELERQ